jgi:hypothetical protein
LDFRNHYVRDALDKAVGPYLPEKTLRSRLTRIAAIAALAFVVFLAFVSIIQYSTPRPAKPPPAAKPGAVEILLVPAKP